MVNHLDEAMRAITSITTRSPIPRPAGPDFYVAAKMLGVYMVTDSFRSARPWSHHKFGELGHSIVLTGDSNHGRFVPDFSA
jgi:hypothetical protein